MCVLTSIYNLSAVPILQTNSLARCASRQTNKKNTLIHGHETQAARMFSVMFCYAYGWLQSSRSSTGLSISHKHIDKSARPNTYTQCYGRRWCWYVRYDAHHTLQIACYWDRYNTMNIRFLSIFAVALWNDGIWKAMISNIFMYTMTKIVGFFKKFERTFFRIGVRFFSIQTCILTKSWTRELRVAVCG